MNKKEQEDNDDQSFSSSTISVYIESEKIKIIEKLRGDIPRSTWVKNLIDKEIKKYDGG